MLKKSADFNDAYRGLIFCSNSASYIAAKSTETSGVRDHRGAICVILSHFVYKTVKTTCPKVCWAASHVSAIKVSGRPPYRPQSGRACSNTQVHVQDGQCPVWPRLCYPTPANEAQEARRAHHGSWASCKEILTVNNLNIFSPITSLHLSLFTTQE